MGVGAPVLGKRRAHLDTWVPLERLFGFFSLRRGAHLGARSLGQKLYSDAQSAPFDVSIIGLG